MTSAILEKRNATSYSFGIAIIVTGSENLYSYDWISYNIEYEENKKLFSGKQTKIKLKDLGLEFINYFWTDTDYNKLFKECNFGLISKDSPLGKEEDNINLISEWKYSPYTIYTIRKL